MASREVVKQRPEQLAIAVSVVEALKEPTVASAT